ncbi:MAG: 3-hydroxyacyl-ACP dehydratase FabZ, partial [Ignavibacteriaceae bacterium]|nr:3-hydroxyacyl-ACP dehydratase FabZ [Ignavibacteriaceae bacterium]
RYPFLLVDRIIHMELDKKIVGQKCVSINEPFFDGHFPGNPIMPGVLLIESMAQTGGLLMLNSLQSPEDKNALFMQINNAKFRKPVTPGDVLRIEVEMKEMRKKFVMMRGEIFVDGALVAEADFTAAIVDRVKND